MTAVATSAAAIKAVWTRFVERAAVSEAMAGLGPNLRKEAGLAPEAGPHPSLPLTGSTWPR